MAAFVTVISSPEADGIENQSATEQMPKRVHYYAMGCTICFHARVSVFYAGGVKVKRHAPLMDSKRQIQKHTCIWKEGKYNDFCFLYQEVNDGDKVNLWPVRAMTLELLFYFFEHRFGLHQQN